MGTPCRVLDYTKVYSPREDCPSLSEGAGRNQMLTVVEQSGNYAHVVGVYDPQLCMHAALVCGPKLLISSGLDSLF